MGIVGCAVAALLAGCDSTDSTRPQPVEFEDPAVYDVGGTTLGGLVATSLLGDIRLDLVTVSRGNATVRVLPGAAAGTFDDAVPLTAGTNPWRAVAGDVNGDGRADLVVIGYFDNAFFVRLANADGTFADAVRYPVRNHGQYIAVADLDGNAYDDVVVVHDGSGQPVWVSAYRGSASGALEKSFEVGTVYFTSQGVTTGDFDGDGHADVAIGLSDNRASVLLLRGLGGGTFADPTTLPSLASDPQISDGTIAVAAGDLDRDGRDDLVVARFDLANEVVVRRSTGAGLGFAEPVHIALPSPVALALGDVNGDGRLDLAAANLEQGTVSLLLGRGDGTFVAPFEVAMGSNPSAVVLADLDGDGQADLATTDLADHRVRVALSGVRR